MVSQGNAELKTMISKLVTFFRQYGIWNVIWLLVGTLLGLVLRNLSTLVELLGWVFVLEVLLLIFVAAIIIGVDKSANSRADRIEQALKAIAFDKTTHSLGLAGVTEHWTDFIKFNEPYGKQLKERLDKLNGPATWYIVTVSPEAFEPWRDILRSAIERGITIKWAYHSPKALESNPGIKAQWEMMLSRIDDWRDRGGEKGLKHLNRRKELLFEQIAGWRNRLELYESSVPHFYLAFFSVPGDHQQIRSDQPAPGGTFGFVHLYPMLPADYEKRPAIYLEGSGAILDYYFQSTVGLFREGVEQRQYLQRVWPEDKPSAM